MNKETICEAFCGQVDIHRVPAGLAVKTPFETSDGDYVGFYVVKVGDDLYRLEDSGLAVPMLEAAGVSLKDGVRGEAFQRLLAEYGAEFDMDGLELRTRPMPETDVPEASLRFVAMLLRLQDFILLQPETVESTFREDAARSIEERLGGKAKLERNATISKDLANYVVDMLITPNAGTFPTAVYFATSEARINEAVLFWFETRLASMAVKTVLLLEHARPKPGMSDRSLARAQNHLDGTPVYRGFEKDAMKKIAAIAGVPEDLNA